MTTKSTETGYRATLHEFTEQRGKMKYPGQISSFVDLSSFLSFLSFPIHRLKAAEHNYPRRMTAVRKTLKTALGIGKGIGPGQPKTSIRGHLVRLTSTIAARFEYEYRIVLTEHTYSAARHIQAIAPVVDIARIPRGRWNACRLRTCTR